MRATLLCLFFLCAASAANPVMVTFVNEIQVAPDSLERIEIHPHNWMSGYPIDLSGWQIVTAAGTATVNDSLVCASESSYVVLDRSNTTGTFSLGDEQDSVTFLDGYGHCEWTIVYPPQWSDWGPYRFWRPPAGMSSSMFYSVYYEWPDLIENFGCYLDSTPTFGTENDDTLGGIAGRVLDDHGYPLPDCWVLVESEYGSIYTRCDSVGRYSSRPLGPASYIVSAHGDSTWLPTKYPDSVRIEPNQLRDSINLTMYPVGIAETHAARLPAPAIHQQGRNLVVAGNGPADITLFDLSGREKAILCAGVLPGEHRVALPRLAPGVYFARANVAGNRITTKVVIR